MRQISLEKSFEENIRKAFLPVTSYLYEEPLLLLRQEVKEPGVYSAIIEAIAGGAMKSNEIVTKTGEEQAKCLKYIRTLLETGAELSAWNRRREPLDLAVLKELRQKAEVFPAKRRRTWYYLFSKTGFREAVWEEAKRDDSIVLVDIREIVGESP